METMFKDQVILLVGGTGSWGRELTEQLLEKEPKEIILFSRGEIAQVDMQRKFSDPRLTFVIGDVRDNAAVDRLFQRGIDYVFHLAALKHVPICENQPQEAIFTNIIGATNVINASIKYKVKKFLYVSTDKAVDPINLYGMTKGIGERLTIQANCMTKDTEFVCIRAGNVLGTNGSLVPYVISQILSNNKVLVTNPKMTRFFLTLTEAIRLLFDASEWGVGGETYVLNMPSFYIQDVIDVLIEYYGNKKTVIDVIGAKEGEKEHEVLISNHELFRVHYVNENYWVIYPELKTGRRYFHIWDHFDFLVKYPHQKELTSQDNLNTKEYLKTLLMKGGFLK
jgi:UDP-N-acetylglucosamine 4,6-dehydratase